MSFELEKAGCKLIATYPAPWVFVGKLFGHYPLEMLEPYIEAADRVIIGRGRTAHCFHDFSEMTTYETRCRQAMTEWAKQHHGDPPTAEHYILVRSRMVAMGAATASMMLGGALKVFANKTRFEAAIADAVAQRKNGSAR